MMGIPVLCPQCHETKLIIKPGDKYYCLNPKCPYGERLPTDHKFECEANVHHYRYYVRQLEDEVLRSRGFDPQQFRLGNVDGVPRVQTGSNQTRDQGRDDEGLSTHRDGSW